MRDYPNYLRPVSSENQVSFKNHVAEAIQIFHANSTNLRTLF